MKELHYFGTDTRVPGHYFWIMGDIRMESSKIWFNNLPFSPERLMENKQLRKGESCYFSIKGYSIIHIEGAAADKRSGSKSVFWVHADLSVHELKAFILANEPAKKLISAMPFDIKWP